MVTFSGITIQSKLYESSASLVYRGIREQDGRAIVIKLLKQDYPSPQELIRYRQEYQITRSLDLEGVVKAYSQQDYQRTLAIFLEDFGGESLEYWMKTHLGFYPMSLSSFLELAIAITDTLGRIHAANIIHKDINSSNIVLNLNTGVVKLIDFGIATQFNRINPTFRSPNGLEGTLAYLSPEQTGRMNRLLDYRTDFYSLGVTFYELLTGQLPFPTTDILELVHCHIAKSPIPPCELNAAIPHPVSEMILKLMAKNPEDRYESAWGIKVDLEIFAEQLAETNQVSSIQLALHDVSEQFHISQKLYGREAEIAALLAAFERVVAKGNVSENSQPDEGISKPQLNVEMMLVSGYAGVGKSALVQELYKPITAKRGYFIAGKFDQLQRNIPYSAIVSALQKLVQQLLGEPGEQVQQWRSRLLTALGNNGQLIIDVIPEIELIIGKQLPVSEIGAMEAQNRFNRTFQHFIRVFCSAEHPLVIFLDDLQWIDSATLKLIELMLLDEQTPSLFLIGAYRNNEVYPTHILALTLEKLRQQGAVLQEIVLEPLTLEPLKQLIAKTLHHNTDTVCTLTQLVLRKTEGNPFFVNEFLKTLYVEDCLAFDVDRRNWQWNIEQIQAKNMTDNVVVLMTNALGKLSESVKRTLRLAACVGNEFRLDTLSMVCEAPAHELFSDLVVAARAGLILPISALDESLMVQNYKFLHDRVQQAAYALIDEPQKQVVHLQIGRSLLKKTLPEPILERLFEIVDHLNYGIELINDQSERDEIARLNLMAGQKAKAAIAHSMAQEYLAIGCAWLAASSWKTNYDLALALALETTEVAYLCGDFEQVERWFAIVLQEAKTVLDTVKVYEVRIETAFAQNRLLESINTALQALQQLGIRFPEKPSPLDIQHALSSVTSYFSKTSIEDFIHLPEMTEPGQLAAIRILSRITISVYFAIPDLVPLLVSKQISLSIQYGNTFISPYIYAKFGGLVLCGMADDIESGYQFGQLAYRLLSQPHTYTLKARTLFIINFFIAHWKEHVRKIAEPLLEVYQSGLETGDLEFAVYGAYAYCLQGFIVGKELVELEKEMGVYAEAIRRQVQQKTALIHVQILQQTVLNLMGRSITPTHLIGEAYDERKQPQHELNRISIFLGSLSKLILCYLFSEYAEAIKNSVRADSHLSQVRVTPSIPVYHYYDSLARLTAYYESSAKEQKNILKRVTINQQKMKQWAHFAPMNCLHKYYLVEAEQARVLGQLLEAEEFYEQAIQGARDNEYLQEEALAYELAAKFYLSRGREKFAQTYMKEAHYCYERWGATAKVKDLEIGYPQFFPQSPGIADTSIRTTSKTTSKNSDTAFDLAAVLKASQAISSEIELEQLLRSLMQILIENAGAQTGFLILEEAGEWKVEAACEMISNTSENAYAIRILQCSLAESCLPTAIINYVIRTEKSLVLNDVSREGKFTLDPYIRAHQPQSILCAPLLTQGKLSGIVYLENNLSAGAFSNDRIKILQFLSGQAAIAIANAKLYAEVKERENRLTQFIDAMPIGVTVHDSTGRITYANRATRHLTDKADLLTETPPEQIPEIHQVYKAGTHQLYPTAQLPIFRSLAGEVVTVDDIEVRLSNRTIFVQISSTPVFDETGSIAYAITASQDITQRKRAEKLLADYNCTLEQQVTERTAALQQSEAALSDREQELRLITNALPVCISYVDADQRYRFVNQTYEDWFNQSRDEILGKPIRELLGETVYIMVEPYIHQVFAGQTVTLETELPYPFGKKQISATFIPDFDAQTQVRGFYGLITDIGDRKRAQQASILEERNRMAREIHDTLAQAFTGILVHMGAVSRLVATNPEAIQAHIQTVRDLASNGLTEARRSVAALRPQLLEDGTLWAALEQFVSIMQSSTETHLIYEILGTPYVLPPEAENNLLRIAQEAFTNAIKYADASEIRIELVYEQISCFLRIRDNGRGFEANTITLRQGFGLLSMTERAEHIGAQFSIESQLGKGTEIVVSLQREAGT
ncbi:AAA family ATPase [Leptolyngbya sp. FACHB-16]|uniref:AAA family ATPase n=1 Tax=unclassified Leptolyngbya TaxID=2650499 RepID=UPI0016851128|nr:AAA family ATPase [Leptolyngbya sp. FACHB-16]MBD2158896.1 AAA family ATPase [Leptolyngbya sp. FACHB-16]